MISAEIWLIVCGLAGVLLHSLWKLDGLALHARKANVKFDWWRDYVLRDRFSLLAAFLSVGIWFLIFGEVATKFQWLTIFPRVSFVTMGMSGSYFLQRWLGKSKKWLDKIIDVKTDIADGKLKSL